MATKINLNIKITALIDDDLTLCRLRDHVANILYIADDDNRYVLEPLPSDVILEDPEIEAKISKIELGEFGVQQELDISNVERLSPRKKRGAA